MFSEGRIVSTLFGLLFWDIIFAPIPGVFETPYQSAPLDILDTFYHARKDLIDRRLNELENDHGPRIVLDRDEQHREPKTMCIGVHWDLLPQSSLVDIANVSETTLLRLLSWLTVHFCQCMGGPTLAVLSRLFCEDYGGRRSGLPDLLVWNAAKREYKFVEVKGPGDRLQENQKVYNSLTISQSLTLCIGLDRSFC